MHIKSYRIDPYATPGLMYTVSNKTIHLDFNHNFRKGRTIFRILSLADFQVNWLLNCVAALRWKV